MNGTRASCLKELLDFGRPVADVLRDLSTFGWDSESDLVDLEPAHVSAILARFLSGQISASEVEAWANAIECREDIGLMRGTSAANAVEELATPLLTRPLTRQSAADWVEALNGPAT